MIAFVINFFGCRKISNTFISVRLWIGFCSRNLQEINGNFSTTLSREMNKNFFLPFVCSAVFNLWFFSADERMLFCEFWELYPNHSAEQTSFELLRLRLGMIHWEIDGVNYFFFFLRWTKTYFKSYWLILTPNFSNKKRNKSRSSLSSFLLYLD